MTTYRKSSDLQREAENQILNRQRRLAWARKLYQRTGRFPCLLPQGVLLKQHQ